QGLRAHPRGRAPLPQPPRAGPRAARPHPGAAAHPPAEPLGAGPGRLRARGRGGARLRGRPHDQGADRGMTSTDRFQVVPAAYLALLRGPEEAPEVLLQLRSGTGFMDGWWACAAAGHVEAGETAYRAAAREADEELGVQVDPDDL